MMIPSSVAENAHCYHASMPALPLTLALIPLQTVSEKNRREHWAVRHRRTKAQRSTTYYWLQHLLGHTCPWPLPLTITLARIAPRPLDSDNLTMALSGCRDGCADYLAGQYGAGDDRQDGLLWRYDQRRGLPKQYGIEITFSMGKPL